MGKADKADGVAAIRHHYANVYGLDDVIVIALGDSANDEAMLEAADVAVVIPHADGHHLKIDSENTRYAKYQASKGWNDSILELLDGYTTG